MVLKKGYDIYPDAAKDRMSILVDTSVWVDHLRMDNSHLERLLNESKVLCHPFIIGELACGNLKNRSEILALLKELPFTPVSEFDEYMQFIDQNRLYGVGVGFVDVHLLTSSLLADASLWSFDKRLKKVAEDIGIAYFDYSS